MFRPDNDLPQYTSSLKKPEARDTYSLAVTVAVDMMAHEER